MYVCPECGKALNHADEKLAAKHLLDCWKRNHPYVKSKDAPRSEDKIERTMSADFARLFK